MMRFPMVFAATAEAMLSSARSPDVMVMVMMMMAMRMRTWSKLGGV